jgi:hypothetical protein
MRRPLHGRYRLVLRLPMRRIEPWWSAPGGTSVKLRFWKRRTPYRFILDEPIPHNPEPAHSVDAIVLAAAQAHGGHYDPERGQVVADDGSWSWPSP